MTTLVGTQKELGTMLNSLIELEYDIAAAYEVAVDKLQAAAYKDQARAFLQDHKQHIDSLKPHAKKLGLDVAMGPDIKQLVTKGKVLAAQLAGDRGILQALRNIEEDTNTAYERAIGYVDASPDLLGALEQGFSDERRHRAWLTRALAPEEEQPGYNKNLTQNSSGPGQFKSLAADTKA